jgi:hypothetical protein
MLIRMRWRASMPMNAQPVNCPGSTCRRNSITAAVQKAEMPGNDTTLRGFNPLGKNNSWGSVPIQGANVGAAVRGAELGYDLKAKGHRDANAYTSRSENTISFTPNALGRSLNEQMRTTLHEGMHLLENTRKWDPYNRQHQRSIYGGCK